VSQIYPRALGSLSVASYDSQGFGGGILSRLHTGCTACYKGSLTFISSPTVEAGAGVANIPGVKVTRVQCVYVMKGCVKHPVDISVTAMLSYLNRLFVTGNWGHHRQGSCQAGLGASISKVTHLQFLVSCISARYTSRGSRDTRSRV
jgi:hypothetical protein